jgi:hypothetical protein
MHSMFYVSRRALVQRPKAMYARLLALFDGCEAVQRAEHCKRLTQVLERVWHLIFGGPALLPMRPPWLGPVAQTHRALRIDL